MAAAERIIFIEQSSTAEAETAVRQIANKKRQTRASCALKTF
jgi:hypothetical protein